MKLLTIAAACFLLTSFARAECVSLPPSFRPSSRRIRITTVQDGKPRRNVRILLYSTSDDVNSRLSLTTDQQGVAMVPELSPGHYRIVAIGGEFESAELYLEVSEKAGKDISSFLIAIPPMFPPQKASDVDDVPITEHIQEFRGHVEDPMGVFVPGALVQVFRKGSHAESVARIKADKTGSFVASLAPGNYVAFVRSLGFSKQIVGFDIGPRGQARDLCVAMRIASC
jgi:carboxypeptidase family protein